VITRRNRKDSEVFLYNKNADMMQCKAGYLSYKNDRWAEIRMTGCCIILTLRNAGTVPLRRDVTKKEHEQKYTA
jgi:hypothetical protein